MTTPAQDLFAQARELPAVERDAFLQRACSDNADHDDLILRLAFKEAKSLIGEPD